MTTNSSITAASFNAPAADLLEIHLAKNAGLNSIQILDDRSTLIRGGFDTCADTTPSGRSVIDGSAFSGAIFVVTLALIPISDGKIDVDEAAPAIVGSFCCCSLSLVFVLVGVILLLVSRSSRTNQQ